MKRLVGILLAVGIAGMIHCGRHSGPSTARNPVLLVGIDGGDWGMLLPLVKTGQVPAIARLIKAGSIGRLTSLTMASPVEWTTVVTGKTQEKHGIRTWAKPQPGARKEFTVITRKNRTSRTLWNILSDRGHTVGIVGWWASWPAESVKGIMLTDSFIYRQNLAETVFPAARTGDFEGLAVEAGKRYRRWLESNRLTEAETGGPGFSDDVRIASGQGSTFFRQLSFDFVKQESARAILRQDRPDFTAVYFRASDLASHFFTKDCCLENGQEGWAVSDADRERFGHVLPAIYRLYGEFLAELGESGDRLPTVILVSDHGFGPGGNYQEFQIRKLLKFAGLKIGDNPLSSLLQVLPAATPGEIRLSPAAENPAGATRLQLERLFKSLATSSGDRLFTTVRWSSGTASTAAGGVSLELVLNSAIRLSDTLVLPDGPQPVFKFFRYSKFTGSHREFGIVLLSGERFRPATVLGPMSTPDLCPLILQLFGLPRAADMDGRVDPAWLNPASGSTAAAPAEIPSYEIGGSQTPLPEIAPDVNQKIVEELRSIGYL